MAAITNAGIGSGLDLESIIKVYVNAEKAPQEAILNKKEETTNTQLSGIGKLKSAISSFQAIVKKLADAKSFDQSSVNITGPDTDAFTVDTDDASNGSFQIEVQQLAKGTRLASNLMTSGSTFGAGTLSFSVGDKSVDVTVDAGDTLNDIRQKINDASGELGVSANVVNTDAGSQLTLTSSTTGAANNLTVNYSGDTSLAALSTGLNVQQAAQDAVITVDGATVSNDTNTFDKAIAGVSIEAKSVTTGANTLDISRDTDSIKKLVQDFVDGYNTLKSSLDDLGAPGSGGDSDDAVQGGDLAFDPLVRSLKSQVQTLLTGSVASLKGQGGIDNLYGAGITFDNQGKMSIASFGIGSGPSGDARLEDAINNKISQLGQLFAGDDGLAVKLDGILDTYSGSDGAISQRQTALNDTLKNITKQRSDLENRLSNYESTMRKKFDGLDQIVAKYKETGNYLTNALKGLPTSSSSE
ncbi:flagellar filament capping protein FliD [Gallaecimonas mangrovi]|uniref:flagellar filament capping protein FliD n=1 Tax=Gallaecimonas mangrovi TaxID=2291597 RepID=UPI000E209C0B|nr:flagellar filament capping protein FliD [Gallaecimonas mangrovi]